jgi:hypothetical protein
VASWSAMSPNMPRRWEVVNWVTCDMLTARLWRMGANGQADSIEGLCDIRSRCTLGKVVARVYPVPHELAGW